MTSTRTLLRGANPVPEVDASTTLTLRAHRELVALVPNAARRATPVRRRRHVTLATALVGAAALAVAVLVVTPLLRGAPSSSSLADYAYYGTTAELEASADFIVRGTVTSIVADDSAGYSRALADVDVVASAKGDISPGTTLEIAYTTGTEDPLDRIMVGGEYVMLLADVSVAAGAWPPTPVNADQGVYEVVDGRAVASDDNPVLLDQTTLAALGLS